MTGTDKNLVAVYGSLKKGFYNHYMLGEDKELRGKSTVHGVMYLCGTYPRLFHVAKDDNHAFGTLLESQHEVEVYSINDSAYERIRGMEIGARYTEETLLTDWGEAKIYWADTDSFRDSYRWIKAYTPQEIKQ